MVYYNILDEGLPSHWDGGYNILFPQRMKESEYGLDELKDQLKMLQMVYSERNKESLFDPMKLVYRSLVRQYQIFVNLVQERPLGTPHSSQIGITKTFENLLRMYHMQLYHMKGYYLISSIGEKEDKEDRKRYQEIMDNFRNQCYKSLERLDELVKPCMEILQTGFTHSEKRQLLAPYRFYYLPNHILNVVKVIEQSIEYRRERIVLLEREERTRKEFEKEAESDSIETIL